MDTLRDVPRYLVYKAKQAVRLKRVKHDAPKLLKRKSPHPDGPWEPNPNSLSLHPLRNRIESDSTISTTQAAAGPAPRESPGEPSQKDTTKSTTQPVNGEGGEDDVSRNEERGDTVNGNDDEMNSGDQAPHDEKGKGKAKAEPVKKQRQAAVPAPQIAVRPTITDGRQDSAANQPAPSPRPEQAPRTVRFEDPPPVVSQLQKRRKDPTQTTQVQDHKACYVCGEVFGETKKRGVQWPKEVYAYLRCGHVFGHECLYRWLTGPVPPRCPKCRVSMIHSCEHLTVPTRKPPATESLPVCTDPTAVVMPFDYEFCRTHEGRTLRHAVDEASWRMDWAEIKRRDETGARAKVGRALVCRYRTMILNWRDKRFTKKQRKWWAAQWVNFAKGPPQYKARARTS
ncbi:TBP-associated factor IIF [Purpureocillium lavendulum]|uniref:TBP-associated factor IIF n=1 Tax=Purpureocillium lavendulum TaxID=1247861 RepID=A0AB34FH46_9HYPO|nr:TBP-associated factor IIF [Purpureocillium lavendulum]